jgi:trigger factor
MRSEVLSQEKNVLVLRVEKDAQEFSTAVQTAVRELSKQASIKGFRKGRVPRHVLEMYVGKKAILDHAMEELIPDCIKQVVEEYGVVLLEDPRIDVEKAEEGEPFSFKVTMYTRPEITLPECDALEAERPLFPVTDSAVEDTLQKILHQNAEWVALEDDAREADENNVVDVSYVISVDGEETEKQEEVPIALWAPELRGEIKNVLMGKKKGDVVNVDIPIPEDHEDTRYAGKTASYVITVKQVKEEKLPELNPELFAKVGAQDLATEEEFREFLRKRLEEEVAAQSEEIARSNTVRAFVEATEFEVVPEREVERQYQNLKNEEAENIQRQFNQALPEYLEAQGLSMEEYEKKLRDRAEADVRTRLAFEVLGEEINVEIKNEDVEEEMRRIAVSANIPLKRVYEVHKENRKLLGDTVGRIQFRKAVNHLISKVTLKDVAVELPEKPGNDEEASEEKAPEEKAE